MPKIQKGGMAVYFNIFRGFKDTLRQMKVEHNNHEFGVNNFIFYNGVVNYERGGYLYGKNSFF